MKKLFTTEYGSKLYGTNTPTSDRDLKHVVLPSLNDLLLSKRIQNEVEKTNKKEFTKNCVEDVDEEFIPVQVFARDFLGGQTYALELAYAIEYKEAGQIVYDPKFIGFCRELRSMFLTSNMSALMGYSVNQASLYSFKGERLNAVRAAKDLFVRMDNTYPVNAKPLDCVEIFEEAAKKIVEKFPKYFEVTTYAVDHNGTMRPCVKLLEKILPYTSTFETSLKVINAHLKKYGSRAEAAAVDNVDWKATSHALRVLDEGIMLLKNRELKFPFEPEYVNLLLSVKMGKFPYDDVIAMINIKLEELKTLEASSTLPKKNPLLNSAMETWLVDWLRTWYELPYSI